MSADQLKAVSDTSIAVEPNAARRKLAAILSADVKGFSRLMEADEEGTLTILMSYRAAIEQFVIRHGGRVVGTTGDSVLAEFPSPVEAVRCAVEVQGELTRRNAELPRDHRLEFRIGINLGDVIAEDDDLFGDGVNIAARLQSITDPGGIFISGSIYDHVKSKVPFGYEFRGKQHVKNIVEPVRVYRIHQDPAQWRKLASKRWYRATIAALFLSLSASGIWLAVPWRFQWPYDFTESRKYLTLRPTRVSIAVLPLANDSSGQAEGYFSDGMSEDLITALSRFSGINVTSWNTVAAYKGVTVTPAQLARDLQVRYVVDGSVRRSDNRVRVTVRLSDVEYGMVLWSGQYDEAIDDVFAVQDKITRRIVSAMSVRVSNLEQERASANTTKNLSAYDHFLRGRQMFRQVALSANLRARENFEQAIELDSSYADAYAMLAWTYTKAAEMGWTERPHHALDRAHDLAQAALRLDSENDLAHVLLAVIYTYRQQYELASAELQRAIAINPNYTGNYAERGWVLLLTGQSDKAIEVLEEALRVDPNPTPTTFSNLGLAYYLHRRYSDAITTLEGAIGRHPDHLPLYIGLAAAYAELGTKPAANRAVANVRRLHPFFEVDRYGDAFRDPADRERIRESLRRAGL